jgi:hypothetical protein
LDNFFSNPNGLYPRKDAGYMTAVHLDRNSDRTPDSALRIVTYDLRFVHGAHPGVIWLRTFPYSYHLHEKPLEELARDYVAYMAATGVEAAIIDDRAPGPPQVSVAVKGQASWVVAGHPAEVLELEETPVTGGLTRRTRVVVVRPGFMFQSTNQRRETVLYPVLMVAGYSNSPEHFEAAVADFDGLLKQITVQGIAGLTKRGDLDAEPEAQQSEADEPSEAVESEPEEADEPSQPDELDAAESPEPAGAESDGAEIDAAATTEDEATEAEPPSTDSLPAAPAEGE